MIPQLIYIALIMISLGMNISSHGEPRGDTNAWNSLISCIIGFAILYWGGFFDVMIK